jgi:hypothetical protein
MPLPCGCTDFRYLRGELEECPSFTGHSMASFRPETHKTLISLLLEQRAARKLSLRQVVSRLPDWMHFKFTTLQKIEAGARDVSYAELREIAKVLGTSVAALDLRVEEIVVAKDKAAGGGRKKR